MVQRPTLARVANVNCDSEHWQWLFVRVLRWRSIGTGEALIIGGLKCDEHQCCDPLQAGRTCDLLNDARALYELDATPAFQLVV